MHGLTPSSPVELNVVRTEIARIQRLRALYLQEVNHQIRYNACHERGWTDSYLFLGDNEEMGYGSIKGQRIPDRDTVFEFYVIPPFRRHAGMLFRELLSASNATVIECQSNDQLLSPMLFEFGQNISADVALFEPDAVTNHVVPGAIVRARRDDDGVFEHVVEPVGDYVVELRGEIVATGGFLLHYNLPFADVYMEVDTRHRRKGVGSLLVQEVMKLGYLTGRVPAARCGLENVASRATLEKAGMVICGYMLKGDVRTPADSTS